MFKKSMTMLFSVSLFSIGNAQFLDADLAAIERLQNQNRMEQQRAQQEAAARQARINAEKSARQAKIDAEKSARQAKIDAENAAARLKMNQRDDENYELEMEIKRMELAARKRELEQQAKSADIKLKIEEAQAERMAAHESARSKQADAFIEEELAVQKAQRDVIQSEADVNRNVSEGVKNNLSKKGFFESNK